MLQIDKALAIFLGSLLLSTSLFSQKEFPYQLSPADRWLAASSFVTGLGSQLWLNQRKGFSSEELISLPFPEGMNRLDRGFIGSYDARINRNSYYTFAAGGAAAMGTALIPLLENKAKGWQQVGTLVLMAAENNLLTLTGTNLAKGLVHRTRPFVFSQEAPFSKKLKPDARYSFFSGHTSLTAANSIFAAKVFSDYYPESKLRPLVWGAALALPTLVASQRVRGGKHYPTDTAVGFLFGAACGYLVPHRHLVERRLPQGYIIPVWGPEVRGMGVLLRF